MDDPALPSLDFALASLGRQSSADDRFEVLRQLVEYWHGPILSQDGYSASDILKIPVLYPWQWWSLIPPPLRRWYEYAGHRAHIMAVQNRLLPPEELKLAENGHVLFYVENQGVYLWSTTLDNSDPLVFGRFNEDEIPWTREGMVLSEFLIQVCFFEGISAAPYGASASWIDELELAAISSKLPELPFQPWRWPSDPTRFFGDSGAFMVASPNGVVRGMQGYSVWVGAKHSHLLTFLKALVDTNWEHVAIE